MQGKIGRRKVFNLIITILFLLYLAAVLKITVFRQGFDVRRFLQNGTVNLTVMEEYIILLQKGSWGRFVYLFAGNIVWFIPLGFYLKCIRQVKGMWLIMLIGFSFSLMIESMQYFWGTGISEADDLILNTFGTFIGAMLGKIKVFQEFCRYTL